MKTRFFNQLSTVSKLGLITKSSDDSKIDDESEFIDSLPPEIGLLFPRVISRGPGWYTMEYYGYPSINTLIDHSKEWEIIAERIARALELFRSHPAKISQARYLDFYAKKFFDRVDAFYKANPELDKDLIINGKQVRSISALAAPLLSRFTELYDEDNHCIMHGDLCFGNILYEPRMKFVRLIDPRGRFGSSPSIYGDQKYDAAKLLHSAVGCYDSFISGDYSITRSSSMIDYDYKRVPDSVSSPCKEAVSHLDVDKLRFIMATLFISMAPLHSDDTRRQIALYAHGLTLLHKLL